MDVYFGYVNLFNICVMAITTKELLDAKLKGLKAEVSSGYDILIYKVDEILKHQKETNGQVKIIKKETTFYRWCHRNYKTAIVMGIILISIIIYGITEIGIVGLLKLAK